jgi:hypothetical protein
VITQDRRSTTLDYSSAVAGLGHCRLLTQTSRSEAPSSWRPGSTWGWGTTVTCWLRARIPRENGL